MRAPIWVLQLLVGEVGGHQDRALGLVALVDQRVELLEDPVGALLGAEVVDVEEVDRGQPLEEREVGVAARLGLEGAADPRQQLRQRVDRDRAAGLDRALGDEHRERRLAGPGVAEQPEAAALVEPPVELVDEGADLTDRRPRREVPGHVADRRPVEGDAAVAGRDHRGDPAAAPAPQPLFAALARPGDVFGAEDPARPVADAERAGGEWLGARDRHQKSGPTAATSSIGAPSPAGCSIGFCWLE